MKNLLRKLLILAFVAAASTNGNISSKNETEDPRERKGFKLLGTTVKSKLVNQYGIETAISEHWNYWESVNAADWEQAKQDCEDDDGTLLYIETPEEVLEVARFLRHTATSTSSYWVGGMYNTMTGSFVWENGVPIGSDAPWAAGQPKDKRKNTRVALIMAGREIELETHPNTVTTRFICEGTTPTIHEVTTLKPTTVDPAVPVTCSYDNDLAIVVDASGSVGKENFELFKHFTAKLVTTWTHEWRGNRIAVFVFATKVKTIHSFTEEQDASSISRKVYNMNYYTLRGSTYSHLAIKQVRQEYSLNKRNVAKYMVFLTDGESTYPEKTRKEAVELKKEGVQTFSVGIRNMNQNDKKKIDRELLDIAGNRSDRVFLVNQFDDLSELLRPISKKICG